MTHDVLQTDIDLAIKLRDDQCSDEEIIRALVHRRVHPDKAAHLVADLRTGKKATVQASLPAEFTLQRRSRSRSGAHGNGQGSAPRQSSEPAARREPAPRPRSSSRKKPGIFWLVAAALFVVICGALFLYYRTQSKLQTEPAPKGPIPKADATAPKLPATAAAGIPKGSLAPLALELQRDGLHIGPSHVTPANVLDAVAHSLGVASRTNQLGQTDTVIYTYDQQGVLVYSQKGGATNSIVLDCEGSGGVHGATAPFTGTLTVDGVAIGADTDPQKLTALKQLGLSHPGNQAGVWGGRYHDLGLVFAYLKSPAHLSLIEIDLR